MIRPSVVREVTIDLPEILVESLGVGAEVLAKYLTSLAEQGVRDPSAHPPPDPVLCRICERQITPWWFEKHTELCLQEHRAEMEVQMAQEALVEHRNAIVKVLDALENQGRQPRAMATELAQPSTPLEYKGIPIQPNSTPSSGTTSGRNSPASPPPRSRDRSSGFGHHRARSFAIRRPLARIVELVLDLCDTAIEINTPAVKESARAQPVTEIRTQSPQSESRISQVLQWQSPSANSLEHGEGFRMLCDDTTKFAKAKADAVVRHKRILEYSERIRQEFDILVQECIEAAMEKAARIAAGEDSSSDDEEQQRMEEERQSELNDVTPSEEGIFVGSFDGPSAMAQALRNASDHSLPARLTRRESSIAGSTRSSSPRGGSQTPRSHTAAINIAPSKRQSMHFESDTGMESDSSIRSSSVMSNPRRAESPSSDFSLGRGVASSRERKRKSLVLPSVMSSRQHSPARSNIAPSSPLRMNKPRIPSSVEGIQSPITSPVLSTTEFSSPHMLHMHHHRRQSSTAGSDPQKPPVSPRMMPISAPQPRAVPPSIKDFEIIKPISKGAFGSVYLAKKKSTGEYYAIKVLKKADMVAKNQVTNVKAERAIMMWQGESDFVAKLYWTFSSKDYLYLVMEYLNGGDCASLIKVLGGLPEEWAKKYLAEVVLGVEHLHSRGIVHRDLKPDNLLIDQNGHLKLTDFGLSRMGMIGRQKRALNSKPDDSVPDLLQAGPFHRATSMTSSRSDSRSTSFDINPSPSQTPHMTPALTGELGQPSYFSLSRENSHGHPSRRASGTRTDSGDSEAFQAMFRRFSIADDQMPPRARSPIEEEAYMDEASPELFPLAPTLSQTAVAQNITPPISSSMPPPPMALFDPEDSNRRFVGTPDYLAPETIKGNGQDEVSDWWSLGCILFESICGYPPFHGDTPEEVFQNILDRRIDWPSEDEVDISPEAKDLMNRLMCTDPQKRLGANAEGKYLSGGEEIRNHPWFADIHWDTLREDEASFVPAPQDPEDTEYFDSRGAAMQNFAEFEDQSTSATGTPGADYPDRPHDALSRVRTQVHVSTVKRGLIPLHIPAHVREGRSRRLSEPVPVDDFGNFNYKNLPVLEKANKDVIQKLRQEAMQQHKAPGSAVQSPGVTSPSPSLETSPMMPTLKRALSTNRVTGRPSSPSLTGPNSSPSRGSQPSSPLLVQFSTGQHHERRKTSSSGSTLSQTTSNPSNLTPGGFFEQQPRLGPGFRPDMASPNKLVKTPSGSSAPFAPKPAPGHRESSASQSTTSSPRARSQTLGSQEGDGMREVANHYKRRSGVFDVSPSSSDTEDSRAAKALLRVQRRRQSSRRLSQICFEQGPVFRPLDILVCEDHPVSRLVMEKLLEKLRCRTLTATNGSEAIRFAMGEVKFDVIMMEFKLPQVNGADVARMIRDTKNPNSNTPIVAVTGYLKELQAPHHFDALIEKPPTKAKLENTLSKLCYWKPAPPNWNPSHSLYTTMTPSGLRQQSNRQEDSPTSNSSGFINVPPGSYRGSSREDSISSSMFGDTDSRAGDEPPHPITIRHNQDDWRERELTRVMGGLGISEEPATTSIDLKNTAETLPIPPELPPVTLGASAPASLESSTILRTKRSAELVSAKRSVLNARKHESAESGDDEDDELGNSAGMRVLRSPKSRPKSSSKLGIEMMRTNSRGSVISVEDIAAQQEAARDLASSPPPSIAEERETGTGTPEKSRVLTPPEIFPMEKRDELDVEVGKSETDGEQMETPKASTKGAAGAKKGEDDAGDPDPTPKPGKLANVATPPA